MDTSEGNDNCIAVQETPPKQKKLKQALLPFHTLGSSDPESLKKKKRKLSSLSPSGCKSEKMAKKENLQHISTDEEIIHESKENEKDPDDSHTSDENKEKRNEEKNVMKPDALLKYIKKTSSGKLLKQFNLDKNVPVLMISRCDDDIQQIQNSSSQNHTLNNFVNSSDNHAKDSTTETAEPNDKTLLGIKDIDVRDSGRGSSESRQIDNTDTETESSSSEDEDDDDDDESKKSNDDLDEVSGKENGNNSGFERTPKSDKNAERKMNKMRRLTPKQLEKRIESEKKKEERKKLKEEREKQRIEERMERRAKKEERSAKREAEREQKRKEKEEKKLKKQMEIEQKQEEKERKEKAKEEERLEAERKKQKAASTFISFFVPKNQEVKSTVEEKNIAACNFMPFEIKADMKMAPCRRMFSNDEKITFEDLFSKNNEEIGKLYLAELKNGKSKIRRSTKTWPIKAKDDEAKDEVTILESDSVMDADQTSSVLPSHRPKLLSFSENRRPPYWGTWSKKSKVINSRRPFAKDSEHFDYEVDSDEEWEEEEPGESLHGSDDEKDKEEDGTDDYVVDNEFMVPHGYLSDEEIQESVSPETQKCKLQILKEQFEAEMKEKTSKVKPQIISMIWQGPLNSYPAEMNPSVLNFLKMRQVWVKETPIILESLANSNSLNGEATPSTKKDRDKTPGPKRMRFPDEAVPDLIRLLHGNINGRSFLIKEFMTYWERKHPAEEQKLTQISIAKKIRELATRMLCAEKGPMYLKTCWMVSEEIRKKYGVEELTLPNKWLYELTPMRKSRVTEPAEPVEKIEKEVDREKEKDQKNKEKEKKTTPLITQFTKKITQEEMKKQLSVKSVPSPTTPKPSVIPNKPGKRVTLISVPRGAQFPKSSTTSTSSKVSQDSQKLERPGSSKSSITIDDSLKNNLSISQPIDHHVLESPGTCNLSSDKNSVKDNQFTELNDKPNLMKVEKNK